MVKIKQEKRKEKKKKQVTRGHNIGWASSSKRKFEYLCFCHCVLVCLPVCVSIHLPWLSVWHYSKKNSITYRSFLLYSLMAHALLNQTRTLALGQIFNEQWILHQCDHGRSDHTPGSHLSFQQFDSKWIAQKTLMASVKNLPYHSLLLPHEHAKQLTSPRRG